MKDKQTPLKHNFESSAILQTKRLENSNVPYRKTVNGYRRFI